MIPPIHSSSSEKPNLVRMGFDAGETNVEAMSTLEEMGETYRPFQPVGPIKAEKISATPKAVQKTSANCSNISKPPIAIVEGFIKQNHLEGCHICASIPTREGA